MNNLKDKVFKAIEGDSRMIFGKPYQLIGDEWVQQGESVTTDDAPDRIHVSQVVDSVHFATPDDLLEMDAGRNESLVDNENPVIKKTKTYGFLRKVEKNLAGVHDMVINYGTTKTEDQHSHSYKINVDGNGQTTGMVGTHGVEHTHSITNFKVSESQGHTHEL